MKAAELRDLGAEVRDALCVIDRQEGGADALASNGMDEIEIPAFLRKQAD